MGRIDSQNGEIKNSIPQKRDGEFRVTTLILLPLLIKALYNVPTYAFPITWKNRKCLISSALLFREDFHQPFITDLHRPSALCECSGSLLVPIIRLFSILLACCFKKYLRYCTKEIFVCQYFLEELE